ncbi:MAG: phosphoglycerate mutase family protein [Myxococcales bacterium]|nr:phosphoglycerate mutase family protein [Myxococcales bacterium]HIK85112.1 phosphoglycerate mutase family protein [Myxococcales bacterium]
MTDESHVAPSGRRVAAFVRHGHFDRPDQVASAHSLFPLSATGRDQARNAADPILDCCEELGLELDLRIEVSQLLRAWETANLIAESLHNRTGKRFHVIGHNELVERGMGSCANMTFDAVRDILAEDPRLGPLPEGWRRMPEFRLPVQGAESLMQAGARTAARVATSLDSIPAEDSRDLMRLFVAHSGCLRHAAVALGALDVRIVPGLSMDFAQTIYLEKLLNGDWIQLAGQFKKHLSGR